MVPEKVICTHSGSFHADEALAVYMIKLLPEYSNSKLIRSRKTEDWEKADIIVDVCGVYDETQHKYDHHQRTFQEYFDKEKKTTTKLSSAGLIYKHFGKRIIQLLLSHANEDEKMLDVLYNKIYDDFIESVDANDNGVSAYPSSIEPGFKNGLLTLPGVISSMNPNWNHPDQSDAHFDKCFLEASKFIGDIFVRYVKNLGESWYPAKTIVEESINNRFTVDPERGAIIKFTQFVPWKEHLHAIEKELGIENQIKFVLFPDNSGSWRVSTVTISPGSFEFRLGLPTEWRGLRDDELSAKSAIPNCVFVHAAGFIGGNKTEEGALKMAQASFL
ncbi:Myg1p SCDLUD_005123 [Saccharomycodes ludwigii]|nr:hypothetical protein SCDLUD_005123 [Saccharomycodes ludwigii]KAH3898787.1 hypothetical protein SCDLUD_005123 [Saccharomycodes ludwigii]